MPRKPSVAQASWLRSAMVSCAYRSGGGSLRSPDRFQAARWTRRRGGCLQQNQTEGFFRPSQGPGQALRLCLWPRKNKARGPPALPHPYRSGRRASLRHAAWRRRAPAPANWASPDRPDRTTCLRPRSKGPQTCWVGLEVRSSQAGALIGPHALVTPISLRHSRPPCE